MDPLFDSLKEPNDRSEELEVKSIRTKSIAPGKCLYTCLMSKCSDTGKRKGYQASVIIITFLTYMSYHLAKRPISVVKGSLNPNCTIGENGTDCNAWPPFSNPKISEELFGLLDCAFLMSYALAMFVSGYIAEHTNLRIYLSIGMWLTGLLTCLFGMAFFWNIHTTSFFFLVQVLTGITQSTGWPCVVEAVGNWFGEGKRGFIMGIWNLHISVGNILGSYIAGQFANQTWGLSFVVPGCIIFFFGIIVFFFLVPDPALVGLDKKSKLTSHESEENLVYPAVPDSPQSPSVQNRGKPEGKPIGLWGAIKIPGVIEYSLCLFFAKLVSYTFLFWLPFYIKSVYVAGKRYSSKEAADWAILFDVGGGLGGILAGLLTDITGCPGIINVVYLLLAAPSLFLFYFHGTQSLTLFIFYMVVSGFFVNGPYALITTAVSASLGTHPCLKDGKAMAVVTAIIDATGSLGAAVGPLLAGVISSKLSWADVFYMLIIADVAAAILLGRQFAHEVRSIGRKIHRSLTRVSDGSVNSASERSPLLSDANDSS